MPQPKARQRLLERHTPRPLPRRCRMIIQSTILIYPLPLSLLHKASRRTAPIKLFRRTQRPTQVVGEGFGFHVVVVLDVGVVDCGAGTVGAGPGGDVEVGGLVGVGAGGEFCAGCVG